MCGLCNPSKGLNGGIGYDPDDYTDVTSWDIEVVQDAARKALQETGEWNFEPREYIMPLDDEDFPEEEWYEHMGYNQYNDPTQKLKEEMYQTLRDISYENVKRYIKEGADLSIRNSKGYSLEEVAGLAGRLDIVDLIARARYTEI